MDSLLLQCQSSSPLTIEVQTWYHVDILLCWVPDTALFVYGLLLAHKLQQQIQAVCDPESDILYCMQAMHCKL